MQIGKDFRLEGGLIVCDFSFSPQPVHTFSHLLTVLEDGAFCVTHCWLLMAPSFVTLVAYVCVAVTFGSVAFFSSVKKGPCLKLFPEVVFVFA